MSSTESTGDFSLLAIANLSLRTSDAEKAQQLPQRIWLRIGWIRSG
eukprot:CAMPEP_0172701948 /NCGR_PEP_ID=MMETSP1074-20121228/32571_1 /TAXON_ID=2916 /ORGANISM="Ceratium fusus, Strain PA161109" /LENGTH=45 /DNA_ID= /DNA_START= /DNA_END= /DNA_ORIENTATION=